MDRRILMVRDFEKVVTEHLNEIERIRTTYRDCFTDPAANDHFDEALLRLQHLVDAMQEVVDE